MSYRYHEIKGGRNLSEMTEWEQAYIRNEWERLCARPSVNNSERVFFQKPNGYFFEARRGRICAIRGEGCKGGFWEIHYGTCKKWGFEKNVFGQYDPCTKEAYYNATRLEGNPEIIDIPRSVHTKKEVIALAKKLHFID